MGEMHGEIPNEGRDFSESSQSGQSIFIIRGECKALSLLHSPRK